MTISRLFEGQNLQGSEHGLDLSREVSVARTPSRDFGVTGSTMSLSPSLRITAFSPGTFLNSLTGKMTAS